MQMQRQFGYKVYLLDYGGEMERAGRSGEGERQREGRREKEAAPLQKTGGGSEKERAHTSWRRQKQGMGEACLLIGQDTQVKCQRIIHQ